MARARSRVPKAAFLPLGAVAAVLALVGLTREREERESVEALPPNVLFVLADQHSARALGCYGEPTIRTPHLDRLAAQGVRFDRAFAQTAQCGPSRYTIWTGRYATSHGLLENDMPERVDEVTIAEHLGEAGYATGSIGKHHMARSPTVHGFDRVVDFGDHREFLANVGGRMPRESGAWLANLAPALGKVGASDTPNEHHPSGFWADEAIRFVRENAGRPFCLWLSFDGPHPPIQPSRPWAEWYRPEGMVLPPSFDAELAGSPDVLSSRRRQFGRLSEAEHRAAMALYFGAVSQIDHNVGRVLAELDRLGIADRTIVVYTSDHGEMMAEHGVWTKPPVNLDATVRVPLIVRGPDIRVGEARRELVGLVDLMPTLLDLVGLDVPDSVQGRSLAPLLRGGTYEPRSFVFSEVGHPRPGGSRSWMARSDGHKYVWVENQGDPLELFFDLGTDPWEVRNVVREPVYLVDIERHRTALARWRTEVEGPHPATSTDPPRSARR